MFIDLKTWPDYFAAVRAGTKNFEIRKNDRDFRVGYYLRLREYDPQLAAYTGETELRQIIYILPGGSFGLDPDYVILGLRDRTADNIFKYATLRNWVATLPDEYQDQFFQILANGSWIADGKHIG